MSEREQTRTEKDDARDPIEILLVSDANYAAFLATTITSIVSSAAPEDRLIFHIVDGGLTEDDYSKLEAMRERYGYVQRFYRPDLREYMEYMRRDISSFPVVVNYRLFAEHYLPSSVDKALYLDVDTVVLSSLRELWTTPLSDFFIAACPDRHMRESHSRALGLSSDYHYFNSGVLLMNLAKWRADDVLARLLDLSVELREAIEFPDQDLLNAYADERGYFELETRWNSHPRDYLEGETRILHYMGSRQRCPRLDILYDYASQTPYGRLPMQSRWYRLDRFLKRVVCNTLCFFFFPRKIRRAIRKRFNLR